MFAKINGTTYDENDDGGDLFTLTIDEAGDIGEDYIGTFEGTLYDDSTASSAEITNGYFKVEHIEDGLLGFPY